MTRAILVGAGGLGGPIAAALGAAGWQLAIFDPDVVELSNLHRQLQFLVDDIGSAKATLLAARTPNATGHVRRWTADARTADARTDDARTDDAGMNAPRTEVDLVIDASDDPATKFAVCDAATTAGIPYVIAAALRYGGNVFVGAPGAACYRCLFEDAPADAPSCASAGVLGPVVGAIGGLAAALALGIAAGDRSHAGALVAIDDVRSPADPRTIRFAVRAGCPNHRHTHTHDAEHPRPHRPA